MNTVEKYCSFCGILKNQDYFPYHCRCCKNWIYKNPLPIVILLPYVGDGILLGRRGIEPNRGEFAFPCGYLEVGETWQEGGARELKEEIGIDILPKSIELIDVVSTVHNEVSQIHVFGRVKTSFYSIDDMKFVPNAETLEIKVIKEYEKLAFNTHSKMLQRELSR